MSSYTANQQVAVYKLHDVITVIIMPGSSVREQHNIREHRLIMSSYWQELLEKKHFLKTADRQTERHVNWQ